jgi:hypothetical protein
MLFDFQNHYLPQFVKCKEGFEYKENPAPRILGSLVPRYGCFPVSTSTTTTTTTLATSTTTPTSTLPSISGVVICGDGTKALPPNEYCADVNGVNTKVIRVANQTMPSNENLPYTPAPVLPTGQEAVATNKNNTQYYILYGVLGIAILSLLFKDKSN